MSLRGDTDAESGVRGPKASGKTFAGDDKPRGPSPVDSDGGRGRGTHKAKGDHIVTTKAQIHASNDNPDIDEIPMPRESRGMHTRSKARLNGETTDVSDSDRRRDFFSITVQDY